MATIVRLELRMLRRELLAGVVVTLAWGAWRLTGSEASHAGPEVGAWPLGFILFALFAVAAGRELTIARAWKALRGPLPISPWTVPAARAAIWTALALVFAVAFVAVLGPADASHARPSQWLMLWLWLVLAGATLAVADRILSVHAAPIRRFLVLLASGLVLLSALPDALGSERTWLSAYVAPAHFAAFAAVMIAALVFEDLEWMPSQAPKEVRPKLQPERAVEVRAPVVRTPTQVLRRLGVDPLRDAAGLMALAVFLAYVLMRVLQNEPPTAIGAGAAVLLGGLWIALGLRRANARWAFLRAFPIRARRVWGGLVAWSVAGIALGIGAAAPMALKEPPGIVSPDVIEFTGVLSFRAPVLWVPTWARDPAAVEGRPANMPAPDAWGYWPLRGRAHTLVDEDAYFTRAMQYYLHLVHGVEVSGDVIQSALGAPFILDETTDVVPRQVFGEAWSSNRVEDARWRRTPWLRTAAPQAQVDDASGFYFPRGSEPRHLYAFAPAIERLESDLDDRLVRTARWRFVLEAAFLVLALLSFVRLAHLEGPMRRVAPVFVLLAVGLWYGQRAAPWHLAIRDAHLAAPWVSVGVTVVLCLWLIRSIRSALARAAPASIEW